MVDYDKLQKPTRGSTPEPDHIMLSICGDAKTSMAVTWRTSIDISNGYMEYYPVNGGASVRIDAINKEFKSDIDISYLHWAIAKDLNPGTKYYYNVGDDNHRSEEFSFETEPENLTKYKFLIITDQQCGKPWDLPEYAPLRDAMEDSLSKHPDCRFILTVGDNCDNGQNEIQWNGMFHGLKGYIESIPYMMCTGNHDNRGYLQYLPKPVGKFYLPHADFFDAQFEYSYPQNGPAEFLTENYSFDYGNIHFAVAGINRPDLVGDWLYEDLKKSNKQWKLGAFHFPVYPLMPEGTNEDSYPWLRKGIEQGRLDILFNGHEHSFARTFPIKDDQMFDKPSEGTVHYIAGNTGRNIFCTNAQKIWHSCFYPQEENIYLYAIAEVDGNVLTITAYLEDGRIADKFVIDKSSDTIQPFACAPIYKQTKMSFKGMIPELAARGCYCQERDGKWFCAFGILAQAFGANVERLPGEMKISMYKQTATFFEDSATAMTLEGEYKLADKVFRHDNQLYIPVADAAEIFNMVWEYAKRNNLINFDYHSEEKPLSPHPEKK